jgi:chemotaxis protein methyltransferase CheR
MDADTQRLADYVQRITGIRLPYTKQAFIEGRLRKRMLLLGFSETSDYAKFCLDRGGMAEEQIPLIDALTTNKTDFFRELHHFRFLETEALPRLYKSGVGLHRPLQIWSAGCSFGPEPYSLAMTCSEFAETHGGIDFHITASDISTRALLQAGCGTYTHDFIEPVPMPFRKKYLLRSLAGGEDRVRISPEIKEKVTFLHVNILSRPYDFSTKFDIIFCRNVLIYFSREDQFAALSNLIGSLELGGILMLGHSESILGFNLPLRTVGPTVFQREAD